GEMATASLDSRHVGLTANGRWDGMRVTVGLLHAWHRIESRRQASAGPIGRSGATCPPLCPLCRLAGTRPPQPQRLGGAANRLVGAKRMGSDHDLAGDRGLTPIT